MRWRIAATAVLALIGVAQILVGVCLLGYGLAATLELSLGVAGGYAMAGAIMLAPPLIWAVIKTWVRPTPRPDLGWRQMIQDAAFVLSQRKTWHVLGHASAVIAAILDDR